MTETTSARAGRLRFGVFVVASGLFAAMAAMLLLPNAAREVVTDWGGAHVVHDVMFTLFAAMVLVGLAAQIGAPRERVGAMWLVLGFPLVLTVAGLGVGFVFPPLLVMLALGAVATLTHPAARELLRPRTAPDPWTLALVVVWLVPAVAYAAGQLALQRAAPAGDEHAELGHWVGAAVIVLLVAGFAAIGGLRVPGWRVTASFAAAAALVIGAISLAFPGHASSLGTGWGAAALVWALALAALSLRGASSAQERGSDRRAGPRPRTEAEVRP